MEVLLFVVWPGLFVCDVYRCASSIHCVASALVLSIVSSHSLEYWTAACWITTYRHVSLSNRFGGTKCYFVSLVAWSPKGRSLEREISPVRIHCRPGHCQKAWAVIVVGVVWVRLLLQQFVSVAIMLLASCSMALGGVLAAARDGEFWRKSATITWATCMSVPYSSRFA